MTHISGLRRFFRLADSAARVDPAAIDDEMRFHVETRIDELTSGGMPDCDARALAHREFGDANRYRADCLTIDSQLAREMRMRDFLESVWSDLRYAARSLRRQPGFAVVAIITLALGIGATTSVFSVVRGVLLRPLPYANANRLVHVGEHDIAKPGHGGNTSWDNYNDWTKLSHSFSAMGIVTNFSPTLTGHGDAERVGVALVSSKMFRVFHVQPFLGRGIVESDGFPSSAPVAVLGYDYWRTKFGGDSGILGRTIELNMAPVLVVGVMPPNFSGPGRLDRSMWGNYSPDTTDGRGGRSKEVYALLRPGTTRAQAQLEMTRIAEQLAATYPKDDRGETVAVDALADLVVGDLARPLYLLVGASFFVLLIACANLSNLLLARGMARGREIAVRVALGAARARITRQLFTESLLLAAIGSAGGILLAWGTVTVLVKLGPSVFRMRPPTLSLEVLFAAIAVAGLTALLVGLVPALRMAPRDPQVALRDAGTRSTGGRTGRTRTTLAIAQLSLAVVLLSVSTLVIKSFIRVLGVEPGIRGDHLLTMNVTLPRARYDNGKSTIFYSELTKRLTALPGVAGAAMTSLVPFSGDYDRVGISKILGQPERVGAASADADRYVVSPGYFATMGIRLLRGRLPSSGDRIDAPMVCVVDEVFARHTFGSEDPIGKSMQIPGRTDYALIVGVVTHVKTYGLDVDSPGQMYLSNEQYPWRFSSIMIRTAGDPLLSTVPVARVIHELDPDQPISNVASMEKLMGDLLRARRFTLTLLSAFALVAITLASIGLYGVVAYGVTQRRREFGVRLALGARRPQIARMILLEGGRIAVVGAVIGSAGALAVSRFVSSLLFEVSPRDATVFTIVALGLVGVAMLACVVPAHRATTVNAVEVLRGD